MVETMTLNPKKTKKLRQYLRNNMPQAEVILWSKLKGKQLLEYKIRRQYGVGKYVIDFYCPKLKLGIEVDGPSHYTVEGKEHDRNREDFIESEGIKLIRIVNIEIYENLDGVIDFLSQEFQKRKDWW